MAWPIAQSGMATEPMEKGVVHPRSAASRADGNRLQLYIPEVLPAAGMTLYSALLFVTSALDALCSSDVAARAAVGPRQRMMLPAGLEIAPCSTADPVIRCHCRVHAVSDVPCLLADRMPTQVQV